MRKVALRLSGLLLLLMAMLSSVPQAEAKKVCNLLCIQDFKCCIVRGQPTCVPISQVCR